MVQRGRDIVEKEVAVLFMLCYVGVKKFNDLHRVKVDDLKFMETGNVGLYMAKRKTDSFFWSRM